MKDVESCEKLWWAGNKRWARDVRMGEPGCSNTVTINWIHRLIERTRGTETSKYPKEKKSKEILLVAASERGRAWRDLLVMWVELFGKAGRRGWKPRIRSMIKELGARISRAGHEKSCLNMGGPSSKAKYSLLTDSELVPWGKGEKNPGEGSEIEPETVCVQAVRALEQSGVMAYLLYNGSASYFQWRG